MPTLGLRKHRATAERFGPDVNADEVFRPFRWALLTGHLAVWLYYADTGMLSSLASNAEPICWPFFEDCWRLRPLEPLIVVLLHFLYLILIAAGAVAQWRGRQRAFGALLLCANAWLAAVISLDYRFRANALYMLLWLNAVFLVSRHRRWTIPVTIVLFYWWAGVLKLNREWLSGAGLYGDLWLIPERYVPAACTYVVILELVLIWGLLARRDRYVWATLFQLGCFHLQSLSQIEWLYPAVMATMLVWFVFDRLCGTHAEPPSLPTLFRGRAPAAVYLVVLVFSACQLAPRLYAGDPTLTGQGRIFALHMFEARQMCEVMAILHTPDGRRQSVDIKMRGLPPRTICDPVIYFSRVKNMCRLMADRSIRDIDFTMRSKRATDPDFKQIVAARNFCTLDPEYTVLRNNSWMTYSPTAQTW